VFGDNKPKKKLLAEISKKRETQRSKNEKAHLEYIIRMRKAQQNQSFNFGMEK
jgi:aminoglycoside phosphotransferase family enzyme